VCTKYLVEKSSICEVGVNVGKAKSVYKVSEKKNTLSVEGVKVEKADCVYRMSEWKSTVYV
jgi:ribosomal protein L24